MAVQRPLQFDFNADKTFSSFFSASNQETINHLQRCASGNGDQCLYLWGSAGLGKSHLLQACSRLALELQKTSFYLPLDKLNLPDPAILENLDSIDLVCIDDIDSIAGNADWERAFFVFFNHHRELNNRLLVSASVPAKELAIDLPDLKTRLAWGLTLKLKIPSETDRVDILSYKAQQLGFDISPQVGQFLLTRYARDLPSLWTMLDKIDHETLAAKRKLTIPFLKQILDKSS